MNMDGFVEYNLDKGWWMDLFLHIGALVCEFPELSAKNGDLFYEAMKSDYDRFKGDMNGKNDKSKERIFM